MTDTFADACRNCRRPLGWVEGIGWLHEELPQYAGQEITCTNAVPVCERRNCDHSAGPKPACPCACHKPGGRNV